MDIDEAVCVSIGERPEQDVVQHSEHGGGGADPNSQDDNAQDREGKVCSDLTQTVGKVRREAGRVLAHGFCPTSAPLL